MTLGTFSFQSEVDSGGGPVIETQLPFLGDDSYLTGGTAGFKALVAAALSIQTAADLEILGVSQQNLSDHILRYDQAGDLLTAQLISTGAEVGNGVNLSGITFEVVVLAR